jgi:hypothetical protein
MTQQATPKILTADELLALLKKSIDRANEKFPIVLWPCKRYDDPLCVETGHVLFLTGENDENADILWLDGHSSRNDTVLVSDILSFWDPKGPHMDLHPFSGHGYLTEAGVKWKQEHFEK